MATVQQAKVFVDPTERFSLCVPEGWMVDTSGQQESRVILYAPTVDDDFRPNVNLLLQAVPPLTPAEYITLGRLQLRRMSNLVKLPVDEPVSRLAGGWVLEWTTWEAPIPVHGRQLIAFRGEKAFVLTAMATAKSFERYEQLFHTVLDSFQLR